MADQPMTENFIMIAPTYSIVLPAYNESARITDTLDKILAFDTKRGWNR